MTVLAIAQNAAKRLQLTSPATFIGSTDQNMILLKTMIDEAIDAIRDEFPWPELEREHTFDLATDTEAYALPADFDRRLNETVWNRDETWPLLGPADAILWQELKSGLVTSLPRDIYRVKGWGIEQFFIHPTPTSSENGQTCVFEYISKTARRPKTWVANTTWTGLQYCSYDGYIFDRGSAGAATTGTDNAPTPADLTDGVITWALYSAEYTFNYDSDEVILNNAMIEDGAVWRFKRERGLDYQELKEESEDAIEAAKTKLGGSVIISYNDKGSQLYPVGLRNYPESDF